MDEGGGGGGGGGGRGGGGGGGGFGGGGGGGGGGVGGGGGGGVGGGGGMGFSQDNNVSLYGFCILDMKSPIIPGCGVGAFCCWLQHLPWSRELHQN